MSEPAPADHRVREQQMPEALVAVEAGKIEKSWPNNVYETHTRSWRVAARHRRAACGAATMMTTSRTYS
jgi:N-acetylneuraminic acid mutarotase